MLNGVGGSTIAEAKERLSYAEYRAWVAYLNKRGSLHPGHRLELALARIAALLGHALGADADPDCSAARNLARICAINDAP
ncbi:TPA: hypothetical protein NIE30_000745 [Pseudomonas aeruginosa]|nr:hypothetical protein [Pseudomonas aeruginosa]